MKGLIVYCLDRIIRRGCRSCLRWYLSVLSRLIDTLDCYISKLKTFGADFSFKVLFIYFLSPPTHTHLPPPTHTHSVSPSSCNQEIWTCIIAIPPQKREGFYLAPPEVYSKSSDKSHKTWLTLRLLIQMMKVHQPAPRRVLGSGWCKIKLQSKCLNVNTDLPPL